MEPFITAMFMSIVGILMLGMGMSQGAVEFGAHGYMIGVSIFSFMIASSILNKG